MDKDRTGQMYRRPMFVKVGEVMHAIQHSLYV